MQQHNGQAEKPTESRIIDGELADQLDDLIEHVENIPWAQVPAVSATTAATFNRKLIESRAELLTQPRLVADGGEEEPPEPIDVIEPQERLAIEAHGLHNAQMSRGTAGVVVGSWPSKPVGKCIAVRMQFPNGTISGVDLSPDEARAFGEALVAAADEASAGGD